VSDNGPVTAATDPRPAGRPRSEAVSRAILDATLELIAEQGSISTVSIEGVAARSGTSKTTIYRRWASKEELVTAAVDSIKAPAEMELPHISVRDDLLRLGRTVRSSLSEKELRILRVMMLESGANPELAEQQQRTVARRRDFSRSVFRYWVERGELREDIDVGIAAAMFVNTVLMIVVYDHYPDLRTPDVVERVVDHLLAGLRPR